ncbi:MAG: hypothetical protein GQ533_14460 [Methanosarcinaceae archaeon]|nr:hypothetical protein [Methanosarcinaceae archaeon]
MMQTKPNLTPVNINELGNELSTYSNQYDLRHDLHAYVEYMQNRDVKRLHRNNELNKSDLKRLAKLMGDSSLVEEVKADGYSNWINYIDELALLFEFVDYDTEGIYAGYTSREPSFPENYIEVNTKSYEKFINLPLMKQENKLLELLVKNGTGERNEFYEISPLGILSVFSIWGSATGVMSGLDFAGIRLFLLNILQSCKPGVWYSTSSLIQYLKNNHLYFLIPKNPKYEHEFYAKKGRYCNFHEDKIRSHDVDILESDTDVFERVEGRYVERFLEGLPLILGYINVAYSKTEYKGNKPEMNQLQAFRVNDMFLHVMSSQIIEPKITVQPNFEIHVESELYPIQIIAHLSKFADVVTKDKTSILKLQKKKVLTQLSNNEGLDVNKFLEDITGQKLPQNVQIELEEWTGASEAFTLYENAVLLEGDKNLPQIEQFTIESISPTMRIVHSPDVLFKHLEQKELIPFHVKHRSSALALLPSGARTVFPKPDLSILKAKTTKKAKKSVKIKREVQITFHFPAKTLMEEFRKALITVKCPVAADWSKLTLSFASQYEPEVKKVSKALKQDYTIKIEDIA